MTAAAAGTSLLLLLEKFFKLTERSLQNLTLSVGTCPGSNVDQLKINEKVDCKSEAKK